MEWNPIRVIGEIRGELSGGPIAVAPWIHVGEKQRDENGNHGWHG